MRFLLFALLYLICASNCYSQTTDKGYGRVDVEFTKEKHSKKMYAKAEIIKAFAGGDSLWLRSLEKKLNESLQINKGVKKGKYIVSVQFILSRDGSLTDIKPLNDPGFGMTEHVLSILKRMTLWKPTGDKGRPVYPYRRSAITYQDSVSQRR